MKQRKFKLPGLGFCIFALLIGAALLYCPEKSVQGVINGLNLCAGVVVPALFPFLVLSAFAVEAPCFFALFRLLSPLMRHVFRLPDSASAAVIFGLFGGYPVGCSTAARLLERGELDKEQAQRLCCFCVNCGPAFAVTAVGYVMLGSAKCGAVIFLSLVSAALLMGFLLGLTAKKPPKASQRRCVDGTNLQALVSATEGSAHAIIKICAWTVLFSCAVNVAAGVGLEQGMLIALKCVLDVTSGCAETAGHGNICVQAALLGWGGLCVACQVLGAVRSTGLSVPVFFAFRAVHAALSSVICGLLLRVFPLEQSVFNSFSSQTVVNFSSSVPAGMALLGLCAVFILDLDRNKKMC